MTVELYPAFRRDAPILTGRPTVVRFRKPVVIGLHGQAYLKNGLAIIDADPWLGYDDLYSVYLHEAGHIRAGSATTVVDPDGMPQSVELSALAIWQRKNHPDIIKIESEADRRARVWMDYADQHYKQYPGTSTVARKLAALENWVPPIEYFIRSRGYAIKTR